MQLTHTDIKKAIIRGQHCQRNWDLEKDIPEADLDLLIHSVTKCPSKQNSAFYSVYTITDRAKIEKIHNATSGFYLIDEKKTVTNSQTLANVLFVFTNNTKNSTYIPVKQNEHGDTPQSVVRDMHMATGIASGFLNLTSNILGYSTGCCACFDNDAIKEILETDDDIVLLMGVGHKASVNRRLHHADNDVQFPAIPKEDIRVTKL